MSTARFVKLEDQRRRLFVEQFGRCADPTCCRQYRSSADMEMAHRISESKANIKKYGFERIDHPLNKGMVCRERWAGHDCNAALLIDNHPAKIEALLERIDRAVEEEKHHGRG